MVSPVKFAHVVLFTTQVQVMRDWYVTVLDGRVIMENPAQAFITYDDEHHRIAVMNPAMAAQLAPPEMAAEFAKRRPAESARPPLPDPDPSAVEAMPFHEERGLGHMAFTFASLADLLSSYERLKEQGITPILPVNHGVTTSLYYADPDGNRVELQIDNFDTMQGAIEFMQSPVAAANPIGIPLDPDAMLAEFRAGANPKDLIAYRPIA